MIDYSEGVYGLIRAFRTAGARSVLMTLQPVGDRSSRDFMETFYDIWLSSDDYPIPAEALHRTRLYFINHPKEEYRDPSISDDEAVKSTGAFKSTGSSKWGATQNLLRIGP